MNIKEQWIDSFEERLWEHHTCDRDTGNLAASHMQGNYKTSDIEYWVDEVEFCEVWK